MKTEIETLNMTSWNTVPGAEGLLNLEQQCMRETPAEILNI